jgi:hypothetical protein
MSDKSFEQQVREELSDLRMKPTAAVWETVAASLKKERKRRWVLWIFFLLVGLSGATLWWLTQEQLPASELSKKNNTTQHSDSLVPSTTLSKEDKAIITADTKTVKTERDQSTIKKNSSGTTAFIQTTIKPVSVNKSSIDNEEAGEKEKSNQETRVIAKDISKKENETQGSVNVVKTETTEREAGNSTQQNEKQQKADTVSVISTQDLKKDTTETIKQIDPVKPALVDSSAPGKNKIAKATKWQWRIGFNAGTSGVRNSIRSLLENNNSRAYDNAFSGNSAPITGPPGGVSGAAANTKPVVRDAFSFGVFMELVRKLGKKEKHAIGLTAGYHLFSTRTGVGSLNTGTVQFSNVNAFNDANKYYGVKDSASYTSYYHFIQLGLRYYQSLKWFKKVDMQWYAGIGVNALLGSNGLHLGAMNTNAYLFQNRSLLRTMQMDISGGVDIGLGKSKQIYLGPQVQYMLSNLSKQPGVNQHLFRPSLRLSFALDKRK